MVTAILILAGLIVAVAAWLIANGANQRKRARMAGGAEVVAQEAGAGAPQVSRASGIN